MLPHFRGCWPDATPVPCGLLEEIGRLEFPQALLDEILIPDQRPQKQSGVTCDPPAASDPPVVSSGAFEISKSL